MGKEDLNVMKKDTITYEELEQDMLRMKRDVKKELKPYSKNELIRIVTDLLVEKFFMKKQIEELENNVKKEEENEETNS